MILKKYWYSFILIPVSVFVSLFFLHQINQLEYLSTLSKHDYSDSNIILIVVDTLRVDHLSSYGYKLKTTPNLDNFFKNAVYFRNHTSASSWTVPSIMSIMTGILPSQHNVTNKYTISDENEDVVEMKLKDGVTTIAESLKNNRYITGAFTGGAGVNSDFGFDRGFDTYYDETNFGGFSESINQSLSWIQNNKDKKMFIFLHGYDVHNQFPIDYDYRFVKNYTGKLTGSVEEQKSMREQQLFNQKLNLTEDDTNFMKAIYDERIQRMDENLNRFFEEYSKLTNDKKTIFIFTSDHGDEFYDHSKIDHGHSLYNELINVPLIIKLPGQTKQINIHEMTSSLDIFPTIMNLSHTKNSSTGNGLNLFSNLKINREIISETVYRYLVNLKSVKLVNGWKIIRDLNSNQKSIYNTFIDSGEKHNLDDLITKYFPKLSAKFNLISASLGPKIYDSYLDYIDIDNSLFE